MILNHILLIDDSEIDNLVNKRMLERAGFQGKITVKKSALAAIEYLQNMCTSEYDELPDIIYLDIRMPEIDGFGFLELFGKLPDRIQHKIMITMLSSSIDLDDHRRAMSYPNVISFLNKPLSKQAISEVSEKWLRLKRAELDF
jgi:CheY-like chemotaxis protein